MSLQELQEWSAAAALVERLQQKTVTLDADDLIALPAHTTPFRDDGFQDEFLAMVAGKDVIFLKTFTGGAVVAKQIAGAVAWTADDHFELLLLRVNSGLESQRLGLRLSFNYRVMLRTFASLRFPGASDPVVLRDPVRNLGVL